MSDFSNPCNTDAILKELNEAKTEEDGEEIINAYFPGWIVDSLPDYSADYPHLRINWSAICDKLKVKKQKIILVEELKFDSNHTTINTIAELLTRKGYVIRRVGEFGGCPICKHAIPCVEVWHLLKEKRLPVPAEWSGTCRKCQ